MSVITVVITSYNLEKHIDVCLRELLAQSFQDFDILVVDDCSKDDTVRIVRGYTEKYKDKIKLIITPHNFGAPGLTRNYAMDSGLIDGEFVIFLDGDDGIEADLLEKLYLRSRETGADIAICAYDRVVEGTGKVLCTEMTWEPSYIPSPAGDERTAYINTALWNKLFRTSLIGENRIPEFRVGEDAVFSLSLYKKANAVTTIPDVLIHYMVRDVSVISNTDEKTIWRFADELARLRQDSCGEDNYELISLIMFIHIGLSMAMRAFDNRSVNKRQFLAKVRRYLYSNNIMDRRKYLSFKSLRRRGLSGYAIWICRVLYRIHGMGLFLRLYDVYKRLFNRDFKF